MEEELLQQFKKGIFPPEEFNHEKHLQIAYLYLKEHELEKAIHDFCQDLKNYVKQVGAEDKYREDLTIISLNIIHQRIQKSHTNNFNDFLMEFPELKTNFKLLVQESIG